MLQTDYPYRAMTQKCGVTKPGFRVHGHKTVKSCNDLAAALQAGPVAIAVDATGWASYSSGIFNSCGNKSPNFNALLVGAGASGSSSYWKVKNQWSASWGEKGYIRIATDSKCGICTSGTIPF